MCCFSNAPAFEKVEGTNIFARMVASGRQGLAYSMTVSARAPLAMILPLPVVPGAGEDAVEFIDLSDCPRFFEHLNRAFPLPMPRGGFASRSLAPQSTPLKVHRVGDFEASFVPRVADFARLDERFRIDPAVWKQLPEYADYGFAVFQLAGFHASGGLWSMFRRAAASTRTIHPMAFTFPTRFPDHLFFPTVHIHDGEVHEHAEFDHTLYAQGIAPPAGWVESAGPLSQYINPATTTDLVDDTYAVRQKLRGMLPNTDTRVPVA